MITNPAASFTPDILPDDLLDAKADALAAAGNRPWVRIAKAVHYDDPETELYKAFFGQSKTAIIGVDAKLMEPIGIREGQPQYEQRHYRNLREMLRSPSCIQRIKERHTARQLKEISKRFVELREKAKPKAGKKLRESDFALGLYPDEIQGNNPNVFPVTDTFLPGTISPGSKTISWSDMQDANRKCFEAAVRNPIGVRICRIIPQFVLGRGVHGSIKDKSSQEAWDDYWKRNKMRLRMKRALRELLIYGEDFFRYFKTRDGLAVRLLDPSTIWDIVTDPEDIESVLWYHQQYMIFNQSVVPEVQAAIPSTLIIRQIPASDIDHYKINATSSEKRGRSQLFPILGWLLRFKEFANDRVLLNKMRAMFALDVAVTGGTTDVDNAQSQFAVPPGPGSVLVHNETVKVEFKNANSNAADAKTDADLLLRIIAIGAGVSEQFLGGADQTNRASALIQTEPDVKNFEEWQELTEIMLSDMAERVFEDEGLETNPEGMEFSFPALAQEDRSAKLKDIALAESMDYFSKSRSATMAAREFNVTTYNYEQEQQQIKQERGEEPLISAPYQQVPKELPELPAMPAAESSGSNPKHEVRNLGTRGTAKNKGGGGKASPHRSAQMGIAAKSVGRQLPDTKATLARSEFTRGNERIKIKNNRTSGTPLRHALIRETESAVPEKPRRHVWSDVARQKSLETRRAKALARQHS